MVLVAAGLLLFAGYGMGKKDGYSDGRRSGELGGPEQTSTGEVVVPAGLALLFLAGAFYLQAQGGLRMPSPARLDELAGRAEQVALEKAEEVAETQRTHAT
jgi:hypothetical protein